MRLLQLRWKNPATISSNTPLSFGPFNSTTQTRWKKPANTAQTRLETRTRDPNLDKLTAQYRKLKLVLNLYDVVSSRKRGPFVSVQSLSKWVPHAGINTITTGGLLRKYPHIFEVFTHPVRRNLCCKFRDKFVILLKQEHDVVSQNEDENVMRIRKILMMSVNGRLHLHALRLMRTELGLPEDFRDQIIMKYHEVFRMVDLEIVELIDRNDTDESFGVAKVESWRKKEYTDKWLSEFEVKYAFPIHLPTGFVKEPGFKEKLKNWQRLPYVKPYERESEVVRKRTFGGIERYEKRAVAIIHELLSLTVENLVPVERMAHFKKDLGIEVNIRELLLKHPGIFYISTKGITEIVFLREAYSKGCLIEPNPIYDLRRKLLELLLLGNRHTRELRTEKEVKDESEDMTDDENGWESREGDFVIPILESFTDDNNDS
ncbi:protein ROOT PRIMORDIUM DEFECTIVE 1 [Lycium barbarum]|uniref:protein ROOT PRIMORDIUM DEFECTIVE 1 n=1 Tax=Lycium barbarum TaxID=112863 RepID=UPI00293ED075|nr:protein ROOT PRIMORDIUM DEFECTIVE 1 [Lycium barbarum]XP_060177621.1 protein ROOT PRIMORDIUM DEFECTIVE 1 [Lycium barbarum]XP_060177623.1 protein ROOT PRIMORDIUM DEFECTIVE 1 [Lycium barbarum]XP_060177624.1 protein ROOT PRIMORDIUM DEFECTIVE 1 [Lycium barbarum]XP_060177625.1 protein ROOT PRIMORDIUM DEFECTIVE 1 [Lycium barbarum]XP_060177626.1 protein ROOT PRIMORDIUM DEFECTIVE 1 [Lycium barbarum]XP_060177627.1 protein ROOT PRIMORDIUM DEFECTIVE 1 [Lycium barbarum]XP_060177628.1 protein ROOT PRIM